MIALLNRAAPAVEQMTVTIRPTPAPALVAPTLAPAPTSTVATQDAYAAPGGARLGPIPLTAPIVYQHSAHSGWGGVAWQGAIVWVRTDRDLAGMVDLAPPPLLVEAPIEIEGAGVVEYDSTHEKPHDETRGMVKTQQAAAQTCWEGPPRANPAQLPRCWAGVPYTLP